MTIAATKLETSPIRLRAMVEADLDRVMAIAASLESAPSWPQAAYLAAISANGVPRRIALVAEVAGEVAGFVVASVVTTVSEIESIAVAGGQRTRGIGTALLAELISRLQTSRVTELDLEVRESNQAACRLYRQAGFLEVGRRRGYYHEPAEDAVLFRLSIG